MPGIDRGAAVRQLLHQAGLQRSKVLPPGAPGLGGNGPKTQLPPGTQDDLESLERTPRTLFDIAADFRRNGRQFHADHARLPAVADDNPTARPASPHAATTARYGLREWAVGHSAKRFTENEWE